ncbi:hypothetical protein BRC81_03510 [Halobacteriales archaeon QS_1_68_20]|nr:MAG: hypothetical protein BRC81_03510 [Halobacteriales archaeon QS_1_68_20]
MGDSPGDEGAVTSVAEGESSAPAEADEEAADADDDQPSPQEFIEAALFEAHHLANLTNLDEAELARQRLVNAQSATRRTKVRDLLADACEYLELAGQARRDAAAGFAKARRYARNAEVELRHESPPAAERSVAELLRADSPRERRSLRELRREATVPSYERLRQDTALELAFAEIRSQATDGVIENPHVVDEERAVLDPHDQPTSGNVEEALQMASLEVEIRQSLQNGGETDADSEFQFLSSDQLVSGEAKGE